MLNDEIKKYLDKSVLCWLATASIEGIPNVSPKEVFTYFGDKNILIANIASPQSIRNIQENENVSVSFIEIFIQKGYQIKGKAKIIKKTNPDYPARLAPLLKIAGDKFPIASVIDVTITHIKPIVAPSYLLFPQTKEKDQISSALKAYNVKEGDKYK